MRMKAIFLAAISIISIDANSATQTKWYSPEDVQIHVKEGEYKGRLEISVPSGRREPKDYVAFRHDVSFKNKLYSPKQAAVNTAWIISGAVVGTLALPICVVPYLGQACLRGYAEFFGHVAPAKTCDQPTPTDYTRCFNENMALLFRSFANEQQELLETARREHRRVRLSDKGKIEVEGLADAGEAEDPLDNAHR